MPAAHMDGKDDEARPAPGPAVPSLLAAAAAQQKAAPLDHSALGAAAAAAAATPLTPTTAECGGKKEEKALLGSHDRDVVPEKKPYMACTPEECGTTATVFNGNEIDNISKQQRVAIETYFKMWMETGIKSLDELCERWDNGFKEKVRLRELRDLGGAPRVVMNVARDRYCFAPRW